MANAAGLEVRESGRALRFHTETPHLVSTGSGRLSTTVTLHPLPEGRIILGSSREADIQLGGTGVEIVHCIIENAGGSVTLQPLSGSTCVDGVPIAAPLRLTQGCMLTIGRSNYLRFNHPAEAKHLKSVLPNTRLSVAPMSFESLNGCNKPPAAPPRKSPRNSGCSDEEVNFLGKLSKFEMLARQARANCVSPKVFPSGSLTTSVPADQILGHSRSSSLVSLGRSSTGSPFQNLTNLDRCQNNDEQKQCSLPITVNRNYSPNQNAIYQNVGSNNKHHHQQTTCSQQRTWQQQQHHQHQRVPSQELDYGNNDENRNNVLQNGYSNEQLMSRSLVCQKSCELNQFSREFDMSQSLIVAKTTTCTEFLQLEQFGSNPSLPCHRRAGSCDSQNTQGFGSHPNIRRIQTPSPAFNRDPKYSDSRSLYGRIKSPSPAPQTANHKKCYSLEELQEAEGRMRLAQEDRIRDQELERQEKMRLEEILAMCAEYERQSSRAAVEKPQRQQQQQNRIKAATNGCTTLSRDSNKRPYAGRPKSPPTHDYENHQLIQANGESTTGRLAPPAYENVATLPSPDQDQQVATPNNNRAPNWPEPNQQNGYASSRQQSPPSPNYEEIGPENYRLDERQTTNGAVAASTTISPPLPEKSIKLAVHHYENFVPRNGNLCSVYENVVPAQPINNNNNNNNINNSPNNLSLPRPSKKPRDAKCELMIDNKLDVSNDDLLEAIEQLSMLSKPRNSGGFSATTTTTTTTTDVATEATPITTTPKRINSERDNAKSNEAKADKERKELEEEDRKKYIEFLQNEKQHILGNMDGFKRSVADIETQEEEINRELELEKALLSAEYESESLKLEQEESERARLQAKIAELEQELSESNASQAQLQAEARQRVLRAQQTCARLEEELAEASGRDDERDLDLADKLAAHTEILETERKAFEDLEFHHLEEEASKLASREEMQRHLAELATKIESRKMQLNQLETQRTDIKNAVTKEAKSLERQKLAHLRRLEEGRNRLRAIDDELEGLAKNVADNPDEKRSPSREDFDRISRVTTDSPIVNNQGSLGRKTIESLKEIERNRQLHLAKQGSQVISEERRRVEELKRRVQDEVRSQWEERKMNCTSFNSVESGEESSSYSTGPTESGSGSSDGAENGTSEKLSPSKLSEFTSPSPGPSGNSYTLLPSDSARNDRPTSLETERFNGNGSGCTNDESGSRPLSQTSSELDSLGPLQVKHRDKPKLQRPLTRYLPIKSESLDLRHHIETAGHQLPLIHDVNVDTTSCSGYLSKMSKKFHHWNKRWFVFDRKRKTLTYYSDNNSRKPRGVIYFQSIEEVYVDHMNTVKSPQPSLTFIVKTTTRLYHLMAPSPEAMRVWVDVVFTGAEGYHEFDPNL
ncbi:pleckstrin homology-like domain family B member 1 isoform X2 [Nasonia vitripennis]|nr:pleckstrin homology-like domain family B member 1 isoform X2 [Nasonia vitripennis]XP_031778573.1 pleckstrin homology-like domain family B member 1 isoform X2 [Nasonia vitripennis]XP_031778575.1 pleckstrin homology-like domain family B member 1 isoform X2 [Nasonia vitripennis]XP_031778576.1 pleckstrin homology-like domain family B member 1 isoform X2 [Nasonia vitripennis]